MTQIRLGLIGDNIRASRSPALHVYCGRLAGLDVSYDLLIPPALGQPFEAVFAEAARSLRGTNVTLPYKERVVPMVTVDEANIARIGAVNTVRFGDDGPRGFNTDYSGFVSAFRAEFGVMSPGRVVMIGAGGVGRAIAFGLAALGADELVLVDRDAAKAESLARDLSAAESGMRVRIDGIGALGGADGVINCTPLGMVGYPGSPVPDGAFPPDGWAFDAVYTPVDTLFRGQALAAGARFLSGYELFFHQGIDAFEIFTDTRPDDLAALRALLLGDQSPAPL